MCKLSFGGVLSRPTSLMRLSSPCSARFGEQTDHVRRLRKVSDVYIAAELRHLWCDPSISHQSDESYLRRKPVAIRTQLSKRPAVAVDRPFGQGDAGHHALILAVYELATNLRRIVGDSRSFDAVMVQGRFHQFRSKRFIENKGQRRCVAIHSKSTHTKSVPVQGEARSAQTALP